MIDQNTLNEAIALFQFAHRNLAKKPDEKLATLGLTRVHHRILFVIAQHEGLTVNALLRFLCVSKQALNQPLRKLIEKHLVHSQSADTDRRLKQLFLTETGKTLEQTLSDMQREQLAHAFNIVGEEAASIWKKVMETLAGNKILFDAQTLN